MDPKPRTADPERHHVRTICTAAGASVRALGWLVLPVTPATVSTQARGRSRRRTSTEVSGRAPARRAYTRSSSSGSSRCRPTSLHKSSSSRDINPSNITEMPRDDQGAPQDNPSNKIENPSIKDGATVADTLEAIENELVKAAILDVASRLPELAP